MRALVTGGAGFIGSALGRALLHDGWDVRVLDSFLTSSEDTVPAGAELVRGDLRDLGTVRDSCAGVDVVFHQGALRSVPRSVDDPQLSQSCNITGTLNVLMAAEGAGVRRVVYASSSSVYGHSSAEVNREDDTPRPASPYAVSKLAAEYYCRVWTTLKGLSTVSLRYFNVFGPGQRPESQYSAVFPAFIAALAKGAPPELHWDGEQARDFTFISDVVAANLRAASAGEAVDGQVFNIGGGGARTVNQVLESVAAAMGTWIEPKRLPQRPGDVRRTHADISLARQRLGWEPAAVWDAAVTETVAWLRAAVPGGGS